MSAKEAEIWGMNFEALRVLYENVLKYYMELDEERYNHDLIAEKQVKGGKMS